MFVGGTTVDRAGMADYREPVRVAGERSILTISGLGRGAAVMVSIRTDEM